MKKTTILIVLATLCFFLKAECQQIDGLKIQPIKIGDKIPEALWNTRFDALQGDGSKKTVKLSDFRDKVIILDFWATWCSACIAGFEKVEPLQKKFQSEIDILLINYEPSNTVSRFLEKRTKNNRRLTLTTIVADTTLAKYFPHRLIPHYVWISKEGRLLTTTSTLAIDETHLKDILQGKINDDEIKVDLNVQVPLYSSEQLPYQKLKGYSILMKGHIEGVGSGTTLREKNGIISGCLITNNSILDIYEVCFNNIDKSYSRAKLKLNVVDSGLLIPSKSKLKGWDWYREHGYSYDFIVPDKENQQLFQLMIQNLNLVSPYQATIKKKTENCIILTRKNKYENFAYKAGELIDQVNNGLLKLNNVTMEALKNNLNNDLYLGFPVLDETGYTYKVSIFFDEPLTSLNTLKRQLNKVGLDFKIAKREINQFTVSDKNYNIK